MKSLPDPRPQNWHNERATEAIAHAAAEFIRNEAGNNSLITVTRAHQISKGDRVVVFINVFPEDQLKPALAFLDRKREEFSKYLKSRARIGALPRVEFLPDNGASELFAAVDESLRK